MERRTTLEKIAITKIYDVQEINGKGGAKTISELCKQLVQYHKLKCMADLKIRIKENEI